MAIIFICGLSLFLYPTISNLYNEYLNDQLISDFEDAFENVAPEVKDEALENAKAYNANKDNPEKLQELGLSYGNVLNVANNGIME